VIYLKTVIARLFPDIAKSKSRRNVSSSKTDKELNGVDISDLSRWYDSNEIKKLNESQAGRRILAKIMGDRNVTNVTRTKLRESKLISADELSQLQLRRLRTAAHCPRKTGGWWPP